MKSTNIQKQLVQKDSLLGGKQKNYSEIVEFLDAHWNVNTKEKSLATAKQLDKALGNISQTTNIIAVAGSNGKSLTAHFASRLLAAEGLSVGILYAPHILTYNERFVIKDEMISNKAFTDLANEVISTAEELKLDIDTDVILTMMSLLHFKLNKVDVAIIEVANAFVNNIMTICNPKLVAITRVSDPDLDQVVLQVKDFIEYIMNLAKEKTFIVSADQNKSNLQYMQELAKQKGAVWVMPIRKLASLSYPFEQLHGRCAGLAERIAYLYVNECLDNAMDSSDTSILAKQKVQRGRPTLEAKRMAELNPKKTVDQFWKDTVNDMPGRFQLLDKDKPTILLDNASNVDALKNILLGVRLLHYQRPLKGLSIILGFTTVSELELEEILRVLRYFFKKTSGQVIVCPVEALPGHKYDASFNHETLTNNIKSMKIKARAAQNFKEAFQLAQSSVDEKYGLVLITGSSSIVAEYWKFKGIKKI
ncbi:hypothetical protein IPH25_03950 [bacterium]|nr:MAG: hypothetical protein IPG37_00945 [bacterium]QQR61602.1 MAG: hypothetical protein IPH25_03950 [bacterium]QQR62839.1 MAG: hypothetical protein IPH67_05550 [bacterium]